MVGKLVEPFPVPTLMKTTLILLPLLASAAYAQGPIPFSRTADWESYTGGVTTGGAFADINRDGHLDMVVANGNDIYRQRLEVYLNDGSGGFPHNPSWQSSDIDYHGHLAVGDIDQDGWIDVAVSVFLGPSGFGNYGHVKAYFNIGGQLESTPSWQSSDSFYSFSCALGDADSDGDLDLAVAVGEPYYGATRKNRIYFNNGGTFETTPSWKADAQDHSMDVAFGDVDGDGDLDLAFCTAGRENTIYYQVNGTIQSSVGWSSSDNGNPNGNSCTFHDVDADGDLDFCVSDNDQLSGGRGYFKIYRNNGSGLATTPYWSDYQGYVSAVAFADLHLDGYPELAGGSWWGGTEIYANQNGSFPNNPNWDSAENSVVEALFFGDLDGNGYINETEQNFSTNGTNQLFYLGHAPVQQLHSVTADGGRLSPADYCIDMESGWLSLVSAPSASLVVDYTWSESLDMGVTNWDTSVGNLVFLRDPLVDAEVTPPLQNVFSPGDRVDYTGHWTSTTNRIENIMVAMAAFPPAGPMRLLDLHSENLSPFSTLDIPYSVTIPVNLPGGFYGITTVAVATVVKGEVKDRAEFDITIQ
jgi:hypothetical protein